MVLIHLDFETFSFVNVKYVGAYRYAMDGSTQIILCCWSIGDGPVHIWQIGDPIPEELNRLIREGATIVAHNAEFEWCVLQWNRQGFAKPKPEQMYDTALQSAVATLPRSLDGATQAIGSQYTKDGRGKRLINLFSMPHKPTKKNPQLRMYPQDAPDDWEDFIDYCIDDVRAERSLYHLLPKLTPGERKAWLVTQQINRAGIPLDREAIRQAQGFIARYQGKLTERCLELTDGIAPTQVGLLTEWTGLANLQKKTLEEALHGPLSRKKREVVTIRLESGRASTKKLQAMGRIADLDGRARGMLLHYGARTGRWAGRILQPQNFIRGNPKEQDTVFELLTHDALDLYYNHPIIHLAESMRGFICAPKRKKLLVADYAQIEARVLAWLAGQNDIVQLYREGADTYKDMAAFMFQKPLEEISGGERFIGKQTVLGCGFQMGVRRFYEQARDYGVKDLTYSMANHAVKSYRRRYGKVVRFWYEIERCARAAFIANKTVKCRYLEFDTIKNFLRMRLPSGRYLYFYQPEMRGGSLYHTYYDINTEKPYQRSLFGGLLTENAVQAIARDLMLYGTYNALRNFYEVIMIVHDEIISEVDEDADVADYCKVLCQLPKWGEGIPLTADGFLCKRYRKG